jgi:hypothetical protein
MAKARSSELYEQDLCAWSEVQADLLRRRRFAELDLEHVVEEIEDVGGSLYREVRSRIRTIIEHLLKLEHSAATDPRTGWEPQSACRPRRGSDAVATTAHRERPRPLLRSRADRGRGGPARSRRARGRRRSPADLPLDQITGDWLPGGDEARKGS